MSLNLYDILPEEISDEEAAHLTSILMDLALAIENHYYPQIRRHMEALSEASEEDPVAYDDIIFRKKPWQS